MLLIALFCLLWIVYPYSFYPLLLRVAARRSPPVTGTAGYWPAGGVAAIVPVYNGAAHIRSRLDNLLAQADADQPLHVFVVSDASDDDTDAIVAAHDDPRITLIRCPRRLGKTAAENLALERVEAEIVLFTDVTSRFETGALAALMAHFAAPETGCVSTEDRLVDVDGAGVQEGFYARFEMKLRQLESRSGVLGGMSGSGYACRRELAVPIPSALTRDLYVPLRARELGMMARTEPKAVCYVTARNDLHGELGRKLRTFTNGIDTLMYKRHLLNPMRYGLFAFALWSHKMVRWLGLVAMTGFLVASAVLATDSIAWGMVVALQVGGYAWCLLHWRLGYSPISGVVETLSFFVMTQVIAGLAWQAHFRGREFVTWQPTAR